jgi:hypothetical protein
VSLAVSAVLAFALLAAPYRLDLKVVERDYFLPSPQQADMVLRLDLRQAPPKARILFGTPLPAGRHRMHIEVTGGRGDKTMVIAVPVAVGQSSFEVSIAGTGRFDLGFWGDGPGAAPREYRFTVTAPVRSRTFDLDIPPR